MAEALVAKLRPRSKAARYALGVVAVLAALTLRILLTPLTGRGAPFVIFFGATLLTSLLAGAGPAALCFALSVPIAVRLFVLPEGYPIYQAVFQAVLYGGDGVLVIVLITLVRRWQERAKAANRRLEEANEERQRALVRTRETIDLAPDAYFLAGLDAHYTDVNQAACRLLGYDRDELLGMTILDLIHPDDVPRLKSQRQTLLVPGTVLTNEWMLKRKDGSFVPVEVSANILGDGRWQAFVRDITERRRITREREEAFGRELIAHQQAEAANAQLRESEERFRLTIEEAPIGMALVALDGRFERVNHMLCEITGYSAEELVRLTFKDITHPDDVAKDVELARQLAHGDIPRYQLEKRYIRKDGSIVFIVLSASILRGPEGDARYYIVRVEDITARKRAEEALERAVAVRDDVLGIVAHDLRNPLGVILMQASLLERSGPEPERRDQKPREMIVRSAKRMNRLIQDLLDVSLAEAGQLKVNPARVSTRELMHEAVEAQAALATASNLTLRLDVADDVPDILGDYDRLLQVFENLIGNAIKFTPSGGRITVSALAQTGEVRFSVADTGAGIAREGLTHVFDRFWQGKTHARRLGAGLGLPITRGIVLAHDGRIWVESAVGQGTTLFFTIPLAPSASERTSVTGRTERACPL
jgi:PAS domain S-box-containing protein